MSYSEVTDSSIEVIVATRSSTSFVSPAPPINIVLSLVIITCLAEPRNVRSAVSRVFPTSSQINWAPVAIAISYIVLRRLSPKPGDLTQQTLRPPRNLFITRVARASLSTSSATMISGLLCYMQASRKGRIY